MLVPFGSLVKWNHLPEGREPAVLHQGELGEVKNTRALGANGEISMGGFGGCLANHWRNSFEEMSITLVLANFLGGFLVDDKALKGVKAILGKGLRRILWLVFSEVGQCKQWDQGCNNSLDNFHLDLKRERVNQMIIKKFLDEASFHQSLSYASFFRWPILSVPSLRGNRLLHSMELEKDEKGK
nr:hypothetical protein [Tanacetum cinerariifolium]